MEALAIRVDSIVVGERHRALSEDAVNRLAASLGEIGLRTPVTVRIVDDYVLPDGEISDGVPILVAGANRLAAAKALGWEYIDCIDADDDPITAELWEIDENLMRAELTAAQEAEHLSRRKRIWKTINSGKTVSTKRGRPKAFAADTAASVGQTRQSVNQKIRRADKLGPDIQLIAGTSLDSGVEMDALAKLPEPERHALVARAAAGEHVSAISVEDVTEKQLKALKSAWNKAGADARQLFDDWRDMPVFDNTRAAA